MKHSLYNLWQLAALVIAPVSAGPLGDSRTARCAPGHESGLSTADDIAQAVVYAYPLIPYVKMFYPVIEAKGVNVFKNDNTTSSSSASSLVRPNADYVYSPMAVDLSSNDVVLRIPEINDGRSYVYPFYDLYGNNFANLGSVDASPAGDYLLRPAGCRLPGLTMLNQTSEDSSYRGIINFATVYGSIELRILLRNNESDLDTVHKYQNETRTKSIPRSEDPLAPPLNAALLGNGSLASAAPLPLFNLTHGDTTDLLRLLARLAPYNPPENASESDEVDAMLSRASISNGTYHQQRFNLTAVNEIIEVNLTRALAANHVNYDEFGKDWWQEKSNASGDFHDAYIDRAFIAYTGYLQMVEAQALYPEYIIPGNTTNTDTLLTLAANESYLFTFSCRPPAQFWSLTLYGSDRYLIQNPQKIYNLGSTSTSLTYPNGTKVYPTGQDNSQYLSDPDINAPFQLLVQGADHTPPVNWTGNWIPSQVGGGSFSVNFRLYGPAPAMTNGSYMYPVVTKQAILV